MCPYECIRNIYIQQPLLICLCCCGHVWIFVQPTCKSKLFLQPGLEQHLHNSHYVILWLKFQGPMTTKFGNWKWCKTHVQPASYYCEEWKRFLQREGRPQPCSLYDLGRNKICFHVSLAWKMTRIQRWLGKCIWDVLKLGVILKNQRENS